MSDRATILQLDKYIKGNMALVDFEWPDRGERASNLNEEKAQAWWATMGSTYGTRLKLEVVMHELHKELEFQTHVTTINKTDLPTFVNMGYLTTDEYSEPGKINVVLRVMTSRYIAFKLLQKHPQLTFGVKRFRFDEENATEKLDMSGYIAEYIERVLGRDFSYWNLIK